MENRPVFDKAKADLAIQTICEKMESLDLTLFERWWTAHCIEVAARAMMGEAFERLAAQYSDDLGTETAESA